MTSPQFQKIDHSVQPKYFQQALCCLDNLSRARKPRGRPTLSSFDRSSSQIARSASTVALASRLGGSLSTHFRYTPCIVMSSSTGIRTFGPSATGELGATGGARDATDAAIAKLGTPVVRANELDERFA